MLLGVYCPECRHIFPDGVFQCEHCEVDLVGTRPGGSHELLPVFETADVLELGLVRSLLLSSGFPITVNGEEILHLGDGHITATVLVPAERAAEAAALLQKHVPGLAGEHGAGYLTAEADEGPDEAESDLPPLRPPLARRLLRALVGLRG
jgi:hypothetical protein